MPQRRAAKKDLRKKKKKHQGNLRIQRKIKTTIKKFKKSLLEPDPSSRQKALSQVYEVLDKAVTKKLIHANKASRKKSRITKLLKKAPPKPA